MSQHVAISTPAPQTCGRAHRYHYSHVSSGFTHATFPVRSNVRSLPWIIDPQIPYRPGSLIPPLQDVHRQITLLGLILIMQHEDAEIRLLTLSAQLLHRSFHIFLELTYSVLKCCPRVIYLIDDEYVLPDQVGHGE
jgi:hypothetical protein